MENRLLIHNTLSRSKELFEPLNPPFTGLYVCGPTVYGDPHLGHARPAITFDLVFRYLHHLGYKVRYVRNITDVGHLEADLDEGEDKIAKKARVEQVEPMEVAQYYADRYFIYMDLLNVKRPSIEPRASGHIMEQIKMVQQILDAGFAYVVNGSVYFDVNKYSKSFDYGKLSGRILEDLMANTRALEGQDEKRNPADFALWKKAQPEHIMRWSSPWSDGFPGWHLECSAMSVKYLGDYFDIHGGGMDLLFPHHESEIAQCQAALGHESAKYWLHNNMITIHGQKMGKSLGNFITLEEFFTGTHPSLHQSYSPMTIRFFILQAHYRSTLDFSNEALQAADKGLKKLLAGYDTLLKLMTEHGVLLPKDPCANPWISDTGSATPNTDPAVPDTGHEVPGDAQTAGNAGDSVHDNARNTKESEDITPVANTALKAVPEGTHTVKGTTATVSPLPDSRVQFLKEACYAALNDDFNSPIVIANLFEAVKMINSMNDKKESLSVDELILLKEIFDIFLFEILGIKAETGDDQHEVIDGLMQLILSIRQNSRATKDWGTSDKIRDALQKLNISVKDGKEGSTWCRE